MSVRLPDPIANTTTEAYLAYKAGVLAVGDLKPSLYDPDLHFDAWLAYWAGLTDTYPISEVGKNIYIGSQDFSGDWKNLNSWNTEEEKYNGLVVKSKSAAWNGLYKPFAVKAGETYTFSVYAKATTARNASLYLKPLSGDIAETTPQNKALSLTTEWQRYSVTFRVDGTGFVCPRLENTSDQETPTYVCGYQLEKGSTATAYEPYSAVPEMLCDEEALVAYLSGVTDTYPEEIKDPYDVRIVGYLKYLVSVRWGQPEERLNNSELYLSMIKPQVVSSGSTPLTDMTLENTAQAPFADVKLYGDTTQQTHSGKNLWNMTGITGASNVTITGPDADGAYSLTWTGGFNAVLSPIIGLDSTKTYTLSIKHSGEAINVREVGTGSTYLISTNQDADFVSYNYTFTGKTSLNLEIIRKASTTNVTAIVKDFQLELGSTATAYEPYTGGYASPSPMYPQTVNVVTGRQAVTVSGKNLVNRVELQSAQNVIFYFDKFSSNKAVFSVTMNEATSGNSLYLRVDGADLGRAGTLTGNANERTYAELTFSQEMVDAISNGTEMYLLLYKSNANFTLPDDGQLEAGTTLTDYQPYVAPAEYEINLGKNLITEFKTQGNNFIEWYYLNQGITNNMTVSFTSDTNLGFTSIYMKPNQSATAIQVGTINIIAGQKVSKNIVLTDEQLKFLGSGDSGVIQIYKTNVMSGVVISDFQLEVGPEATTYAPYFEPIELCKIGNKQDYIYQNNGEWYLHREVRHLSLPIADMDNEQIYPGWRQQVTLRADIGADYNGSLGDRTPYRVNMASGTKNTQYDIYSVSANTRTAANGVLFLPKSYFNNVYGGDWTQDYWKTTFPNLVFDLYYGILNVPDDELITNSALVAQLNALVEGGSLQGTTNIKISATDPNLPAGLIVEAYKYD